MSFSRPSPRLRVSSWHLWACLTLLALVARAFVPTGYMPAFEAMRAGKLEITFCTAGGGMQTLSLAVLDSHADHAAAGEDAAMAECPFGILAAQAILPDVAPAVSLPLASRVVLAFAAPTSRPPLPAHGPPLGPRAPPSHLG
ncbi:DUF2946 family protein [Achromobacter sp. GG226]|uniref:DUF2946 family protein n=1 Tax=Verticiella alkaliphila TaxID=2779529 RepID=UPI001C0A9A81|nr:DUF2946 family protein [Verticiella sp. GG226]MBU4612373.1 DUF2946 family protein [Verticiella sp. GG226]